MNNAGSGREGDLLAGITWAVENDCKIISMSLARTVTSGTPFSPGFELMARRLLEREVIIVAAAGNDSNRRSLGHPHPASHPANCPSVVSVGAVDIKMRTADFSNGEKVDIAAPGVHIHSSIPGSKLYDVFSGTSMAVPHVSGVAALWAEARPSARGIELKRLLLAKARKLDLPTGDVGAGLVQAP